MGLDRFVSLGDNCEFGFFERLRGHEAGSLLRWAVTPPEALARGIRANFEDLYDFDSLTPSSQDMVLDRKSGIYFHTRMRSGANGFLLDEEARREIHKDEVEKIRHLSAKLLVSLSQKTVFVYKRNAGVSASQVRDIADAIWTHGPGSLLIVTEAGELHPGQVMHIEGNIYNARIDRFAAYSEADKISAEVWSDIVRNADAMIPS